jgi:hypothetical protein
MNNIDDADRHERLRLQAARAHGDSAQRKTTFIAWL